MKYRYINKYSYFNPLDVRQEPRVQSAFSLCIGTKELEKVASCQLLVSCCFNKPSIQSLQKTIGTYTSGILKYIIFNVDIYTCTVFRDSLAKFYSVSKQSPIMLLSHCISVYNNTLNKYCKVCIYPHLYAHMHTAIVALLDRVREALVKIYHKIRLY